MRRGWRLALPVAASLACVVAGACKIDDSSDDPTEGTLPGTANEVSPHAVSGSPTTATSNGAVNIWVTSEPSHPFDVKPPASFGAVAPGVETVVVDEAEENLRAKVDGFGAALTDASAAVIYHDIKRAEDRTKLLAELMSPVDGLGLNMIRLPIAASDSTWGPAYSYDDGPPDESLAHFSIKHDEEYILPELEEIVRDINPSVHIIATPWSPPGWMKEHNHGMIGGTLQDRYREAYAEYFVKFVRAYWERSTHIPIYAITPQNEPGQAANYPSMTLEPKDEATFIHQFLAPALKKADFSWVKILGYDHNWANPYPDQLLGRLAEDDADGQIAGLAFHCYGDHDAALLASDPATLLKIHADSRMRGKSIYLTECDRSQLDDGKLKSYAEGIQQLIQAMNNWSRSYLSWQLVLHPDGTPDQGNGCKGKGWHCVGVVSVDDQGKVTHEWDYAYLGHASKFVVRDAQVVSVAPVGHVESVAFVNPNGSRVLVAYNTSTSSETFQVSWRGQAFSTTLAPRSVATYMWNSPTARPFEIGSCGGNDGQGVTDFRRLAEHLPATATPPAGLCHVYTKWDVAKGTGHVSGKGTDTHVLSGLKGWLSGDALTQCSEVLVTFQGDNDGRESPPSGSDFDHAFKEFLALTDAGKELAAWHGKLSFTAWNEPNNKGGAGNSLGEDLSPERAAQYYLIAQNICDDPSLGYHCTVAAGDFATNGTWGDNRRPDANNAGSIAQNCKNDEALADDGARCGEFSPENHEHWGPSYLDRYKFYIASHWDAKNHDGSRVYPSLSDNTGHGFRPAVWGYHPWHDVNGYIDSEAECSDYGNCATRRLLASLVETWGASEIWDTEISVGLQNKTRLSDPKQACGAAFLDQLTFLDPRITRVYYMWFAEGNNGELFSHGKARAAATVFAEESTRYTGGTCAPTGIEAEGAPVVATPPPTSDASAPSSESRCCAKCANLDQSYYAGHIAGASCAVQAVEFCATEGGVESEEMGTCSDMPG